MKLYYHPLSNNSRLSRAVAQRLGVSLDLELVDLAKGEQRSPEFLAVNPCGRVPVLVDEDFVLWETNAIAQYLCERKGSDLLPTDPRTRADVLRWQSWNLTHLNPAMRTVVGERLLKPMMGGTPDQKLIQLGLADFEREGKVLDDHLAKRRYLVADRLTLADYSVAATYSYAGPAELPVGPNVKAWLARMDELPEWRETAIKLG